VAKTEKDSLKSHCGVAQVSTSRKSQQGKYTSNISWRIPSGCTNDIFLRTEKTPLCRKDGMLKHMGQQGGDHIIASQSGPRNTVCSKLERARAKQHKATATSGPCRTFWLRHFTWPSPSTAAIFPSLANVSATTCVPSIQDDQDMPGTFILLTKITGSRTAAKEEYSSLRRFKLTQCSRRPVKHVFCVAQQTSAQWPRSFLRSLQSQ
jgi:hypothetical protein